MEKVKVAKKFWTHSSTTAHVSRAVLRTITYDVGPAAEEYKKIKR